MEGRGRSRIDYMLVSLITMNVLGQRTYLNNFLIVQWIWDQNSYKGSADYST